MELLVGVVCFVLGLVYYSEEIVHIYELASTRPSWSTLSLLLVVVLGAIGAILWWNHE